MGFYVRALVHAAIGLLFGAGLLIAGMTDPQKVQNFLDITGLWDPSLAFVMGGAVIVTFIGYRLAWRAGRPLLAPRFALPTATAIDARTLIGPAVFGIGWGLAGFCPGPALTSLGAGEAAAWSFVPAMLVGMVAARWLANRQAAAHLAARV
jgi:uncharacterized protein